MGKKKNILIDFIEYQKPFDAGEKLSETVFELISKKKPSTTSEKLLYHGLTALAALGMKKAFRKDKGKLSVDDRNYISAFQRGLHRKGLKD
jgi:hypothetical protein